MDDLNITVIVISIIFVMVVLYTKQTPAPALPPPPTPLQLLKADVDKAIELAKDSSVDAVREIQKYIQTLEPNAKGNVETIIFNASGLFLMLSFLENDRKMVVKNDITDQRIQDPAERMKGFNVPQVILGKISLAFNNIKNAAQAVRIEYNELQKKSI